MVLSTHAVAGAASVIIFKGYPLLGLILVFLSHFILDAIPHWHYKVLSRVKNDSLPFGEKLDFGIVFLKDIFRGGIDFGLGIVISLTVSQIFFPSYFWLTAFGAFAGALPDLIQVIYYRFPNSMPLFYFQQFHEKVHTKKYLDNEPVKGISQQIILSAVIIFVLVYLH